MNYIDTSFSTDDQRRALNLLMNDNDSIFVNIIFSKSYNINTHNIKKCMYCQSPNIRCVGIINKYDSFGLYCNNICKLMFMNLYRDIFNLDFDGYRYNSLPITIFLNDCRKELLDIFSDISSDSHNSIKLIRFKYIPYKKVRIIFSFENYRETGKILHEVIRDLNIMEFDNKYDVTDDICLHCERQINNSDFKFIKTDHNTFIGPLCGKICKYSYAKLISDTIDIQKKYYIFVPSFIPKKDITLINNIIYDKRIVTKGVCNFSIENHTNILYTISINTIH